MMRKPPKYCQGFVDRHGVPRWYFRREGFKRTPLPGLPWSPEFMAAYEAAIAGDAPEVIGSKRTLPGTISALIVSYYSSAEFKTLRPVTQSTYRNVIEHFREEHGNKRVALLQREHVKKIMGKLADRPAAANQWLKIIKILMRHALEMGMRRDDPTLGIRRLKSRSTGYQTWTEDEIATYYAKHLPGSRERLAMDLLLYTGQRRGDVVRMGRQHVRKGVLLIRQSKTNSQVEIPVHAALQRSIDATPKSNLTFLVTTYGKPFSPAGFTNWFRETLTAAGLQAGLSPHGLRKAACRRLAETGCTPHQIMAISGHRNIMEVMTYTEAANRARLAVEAMATITDLEPENRTSSVKPGDRV